MIQIHPQVIDIQSIMDEFLTSMVQCNNPILHFYPIVLASMLMLLLDNDTASF
jgi:hypothetical protein